MIHYVLLHVQNVPPNKVTAQVTLDRMKLPHFMKGQGVKLFKFNRHRVLL